MLGIFFLIVLIGFAVYMWRRRDDMMARGEQRFGGSGDSWQEPSSRFAPLTERRERLKHSKPAAPVFNPLALLENASCEVCQSSPRVQFRNPETRSTLEFCGHHAGRQEKPLKAKGFTITIDGRTP